MNWLCQIQVITKSLKFVGTTNTQPKVCMCVQVQFACIHNIFVKSYIYMKITEQTSDSIKLLYVWAANE